MSENKTITGSSAHCEAPPSHEDEIAAEFERKRAGRATGAANTSSAWQVRIEWQSPDSMSWPPYTYDAKQTREDAEYCALHAIQWKAADADLRVIGAHVRAPGASEWKPVALPQAVTS